MDGPARGGDEWKGIRGNWLKGREWSFGDTGFRKKIEEGKGEVGGEKGAWKRKEDRNGIITSPRLC